MGCAGSKEKSEESQPESVVSPRGRFEGRIHCLGAKGSGRRTFASLLTGTSPTAWSPHTRDAVPLRQAIYRGSYNGEKVKWTVWVDVDYVAGAPEDHYWHDVDLLLFFYAIDNRESFDRLKQWFRQVSVSDRVNRKPVVFAIIGTKADQAQFREVPQDEAKALAEANRMQYFEVASKKENAETIRKLIDDVSAEMVKIREFLANERGNS